MSDTPTLTTASAGRTPASPRLLGLRLPIAIFVLLALVPALATVLDDSFITLFVIRVMIFAIAAVSLDLILGYGALVSFGHAAFLGIGAYGIGILSAEGIYDGLVAIPVALVAAGLFALVTGAISLKTRGVYFIMITLAFAQMAYYTTTSLSAYGGDDGLTIWRRTEFFGTGPLDDRLTFFYVTFGCLLAVYLLCRMIVASRFGRVLTGAKQSEIRLRAIGIDPYPYRLVAYVIAAMICALAGVLLANQTEFVSPAYMGWHRSGELIVMVVLGGIGTLHGAIIGAAAYLLLESLLQDVTHHWQLIFGPFLVLVVLYGKGGLVRLITGVRAHG
ncbi:branched-chain amino acid ABC transporter permease [Amorphus sp. 3PC139-8]|uniref:branched-chain amino acid ABC transporter permease n=1 Tax=Amorphus sp. 3PC139-8 TaxID=2735676 RepID=UPI00345D6F54